MFVATKYFKKWKNKKLDTWFLCLENTYHSQIVFLMKKY